MATNKEVCDYLDNMNGSANARAASKASLSTLNSLTDKIISKYFNINEPIFDQKDPSIISKDFPDFVTKEDLMKNAEFILNYYSRLVINDLTEEASKAAAGGIMRWDAILPDGGNPIERDLFRQEPIMGNCVGNASIDARDWTLAHFNNINADDWRGNAFKHAVYNAQAARKIIITGYSQWTAYEWTKKFATAHEYTNNNNTTPWVLGTTHQNIMDYHNNMKGRSYVKDHVTTNIWGNVVTWPSESSIINDHKNHVNNPNVLKVPPSSFNDQQKGDYILNLISHTGSTVAGLSGSNYTDYPYLAALQFNP